MSPSRYIAGVSWPRSGHHVLVRVLLHYFGDDFSYCEFYSQKVDCCRSFPCSRQTCHFSKNHDSDQSSCPAAGVPYLVQHRGLMASTISNFELYVRNGNPDDMASFEWFARQAGEKWVQFMVKWGGPDFPHERCIVPYEDLVSDPFGTLSQVIRYFAPDDEINEEQLQKVINKTNGVITTKDGWYPLQNTGIRQFRTVESFRFYDSCLFAELEAAADNSRIEKSRALAQ